MRSMFGVNGIICRTWKIMPLTMLDTSVPACSIKRVQAQSCATPQDTCAALIRRIMPGMRMHPWSMHCFIACP